MAKSSYNGILRGQILFRAALFISIVFTLSAKADPSAWLSATEFAKLSPTQQNQYLKSVQKILGKMADGADAIAGNQNPPSSRMPASEDAPVAVDLSAPAGSLAELRQRLQTQTQTLNENIHAALGVEANPESEWAGRVYDSSSQLMETMGQYISQAKMSSDKTVRRSPEIKAAIDTLASTLTAMEKNIPGDPNKLKESSFYKKIKMGISSGQSLMESTKVVVPTADGIKTQNAADANQARLKREKGEAFFRCMYAGFILQKGPCSAPRFLPKEMKLAGINPKNISCEKGMALCNPLIYGLDLDIQCEPNPAANISTQPCVGKGKPICVRIDSWPTLKCTQRSNDKTRAAAAVIINSNQQTYDAYVKNFAEFCDAEKTDRNLFISMKGNLPRTNKKAIYAEINRTCSYAKGQLFVLKDKYNINTGNITSKLPDETSSKAAPASR